MSKPSDGIRFNLVDGLRKRSGFVFWIMNAVHSYCKVSLTRLSYALRLQQVATEQKLPLLHLFQHLSGNKIKSWSNPGPRETRQIQRLELKSGLCPNSHPYVPPLFGLSGWVQKILACAKWGCKAIRMLPESITVTWKLVILAIRLIMMTRIIIIINGIRNNARTTKRPRKLHYFEKLENSYLPQKMFG